MTSDEQYTDLLKLLSSNHIEFNIERTIFKDDAKITGLWKYIAPIMKDIKIDRLKEIIDLNVWSITWLPNEYMVRIDLKKQ